MGVSKHYPNIQVVSKQMEASKHTVGCPNIGGIQTYRGPSKHMGASKHTGHPKVWGIWTPLVWQSMPFCVVYVQGASKHLLNLWRASKHMGVSTHIQGASKHRGTPYVWMPPVHTQHKACFVRLRGCPYAPIHLDALRRLDTPVCVNAPLCLDAPCMFGWPHMLPCMFGHPHMFGCPCMLGHPHIFRCPLCLDDVWMPPVYTQHKKACFVRLRGCPYAPIYVDAPCTSTTQRKHALSD